MCFCAPEAVATSAANRWPCCASQTISFCFSKDFPVVPRSTVRQRACSAGSPFSGDDRGLQASPDCVGSPYSCENSLNSSSPQELLNAAPAPYILPRPHLQHSQQSQVYHCTKRKGK